MEMFETKSIRQLRVSIEVNGFNKEMIFIGNQWKSHTYPMEMEI